MSGKIIGFSSWLGSPAGRYLLQWQQERHDELVADIFGYHALQLGMPQLQGLRANRMQHRWLALATGDAEQQDGAPAPSLWADAVQLPFEQASLDLVLMPHTLELSVSPHAALREAARVLVPEGRLIVSGINPWSLWGARQRRMQWYRRLGAGGPLFVPELEEFFSPWRLGDWMRLLDLEVESVSLGCFRPSFQSARWLQRMAWMDRLGPHGWSLLGAAYVMVAVKRVLGVRLLEPAWRTAPVAAKAVPLARFETAGRTRDGMGNP
ncbi:class I SAM-dependent methyltransferase [Comamonas flocculans]|uniref:Class I SAM-dependent methyltransferase n=1 Tax=Comamonas flocculans TaxID=2597701 RepID=A0A5B8RTC7_9BURK|nr:methyltransferase domain-containing protein [Comamonas flocculans]QEA12088.1 class I SAM-dependent methyltransferase [Comamonas flocculans]